MAKLSEAEIEEIISLNARGRMPELREHGVRYAFIDAGYVRKEFDNLFSKLFKEIDFPHPEVSWGAVKRLAKANRAFYYDCFHENDETSRLRLGRLRKEDAIHVRTGKFASSKRKQQKQVDVLLAVDMLTHAFLGNTKNAVLVSGDSDFVPVVQAVVQHGTFVSLLYIAKHVAADLLDATDYRDEILVADLASFASPRNLTDNFTALPRPFEFRRSLYKQPPLIQGNAMQVKVGSTYNGKPQPHVEIFEGNQYTLFFDESVANFYCRNRRCWVSRYRPVLERLAEEILGPITWELKCVQSTE